MITGPEKVVIHFAKINRVRIASNYVFFEKIFNDLCSSLSSEIGDHRASV